MNEKYFLASDNTSGCAPEVMQILQRVAIEQQGSYGSDEYTQKAKKLFRDFFQTDCEVFFAFNGTAANSLLIASACERFQCVLAHKFSHLETDECSAPEFFSGGTKVKLIDGVDGKLDFIELKSHLERERDVHASPAGVISITQATELGTVYTVNEIQELGDLAARYGVTFIIDGARLVNALTTLKASPAEMTWKAGVKALTFGGTKQGMPPTEAVVFFDKALAENFDYRQKQAGHLCSKMAFLAAPWLAMLSENKWQKYAANANTQALALSEALTKAGFAPARAVQANSVFIDFPMPVRNQLRAMGWHFYDFPDGNSRLMTSWATQSEHISKFIQDLNQVASKK